MQHQSLTAQIASKSKKSVETFEPAFFSEIPYCNVNEINYLRDLEEKKKNIDFPIFEFEKDFGDQAPVNDFDMLANTLYKKIMQNGYIQQKKTPSKKKKKTKNPYEYDYEDAWINDEEAITVKKNIYVKLENFKCLNQGIDQFYSSEIYKSNIAQIQQMSKKRTNQISIDAQQLEEIKKKIKQNIIMAHSKVKQEIDIQKPTNIVENAEEFEIICKNQNEKDEEQNQKIDGCEKTKAQIEKVDLTKQQNAQMNDESAEKEQKSDSAKSIQNGKEQGTLKKPRKTTPKQKSALPKKKKQKAVSQSVSLLAGQKNENLQNRLQGGSPNQISNQNVQLPIQVKISEDLNNLKVEKIPSQKHLQVKQERIEAKKLKNQQQSISKINIL